ncbi:MAG: methyltransferase domain-containing protein [Proteobacteria bacterium]|nr:methyltransferase domain-containing protein [Pseudomonadota bacterium]
MKRKRYPEDHWIRSEHIEKALQAYMDQQSKAYSRIKNMFISALLGDLKGKRFLDYGCGAGMFLVYAARLGATRIVGVDAEETVLSTARYLTEKEGVQDKCEFIVSERWPAFQPGASFDVILLKDVVEHVEDDQALLDAAAQNLAPEGVLTVSTQNAFSLNYLIEGMYHRVVRRQKDWYGWDATHLRFYTPRSLKKKLLKAGLRPVAWRSLYIIPHKFPASPSSGRQFYRLESLALIDKILGRIFPWNRLGWNIIVKAVKETK